MTDEAYETFRNYGYYQMLHPNTNMRIIATISSPMDAMNWWHVPNNTDPLGQLAFLENTLRYCESHDEVAIIIGHIPPGDVFGLSDWGKRYQAIIH